MYEFPPEHAQNQHKFVRADIYQNYKHAILK